MKKITQMNNRNISYKNEKYDLKTIYNVEYITNKNDFDLAYSGRHDAPWDLYQVTKTEDLQRAITIFLHHYGSSLTYDVKLREEVILNGEIIQEQYVTNIINFDSICTTNTARLTDIIRAKDEIINLQSEKVEETEILKGVVGEDKYNKFIAEQRVKQA